MVNDEFILNPTYEQKEEAQMELLVVGLKEGIVMIEGEAKEVSEAKVVEGLKFAQDHMGAMVEAQEKFRKEVGKDKKAEFGV